MALSKQLMDYGKYLLIIVITVVVTYFAPRILTTAWYVFLLILYYRSSDEPFWLAFFLATTDGFMSFMGLYEVTITILPGLPAIELIQFYILLALVKTLPPRKEKIFYGRFLEVLGAYVIFMIIWGAMMGISGGPNSYFRIVKLALPLMLFYSLPRLFRSMASYDRLFGFIFVLLITGFIAQLITIIGGESPAGMLNITFEKEVEPGEYRGFYNMAATLIGLSAALFYLSGGRKGVFGRLWLYLVVFSAFMMTLLSATRGWILGFSLIMVLTLAFAKIDVRRMTGLVVVIMALSYFGWSNTRIRQQVEFSRERLESLESFREGDITAGGTLKRLTVRGPKVMSAWRENPIFGWGFSDTAWLYTDIHVANHNLLMMSGIVGFGLLVAFFLFFSIRMLERYLFLPVNHPLRNPMLVFVIFLWGWVLIHSTSGQHFSYGGVPLLIAPQAVIFSFAAFIYKETFRLPKRKKDG